MAKLQDLKKSLCGSFQKMLGLSTASELYGTQHKNPNFIVNMGNDCYTNNEKIVLGLNCSAYDWCETKEDLYECSDYIKGHEIQHIKSTTNKAWQYAMYRGCEVIIERLCKDNGVFLRLNNNRDYNLALEKLRKEKGIYLSTNVLQHLVHYITNSLEDGRIENIRASENEVFKKQMVHIRLLNWSFNGIAKEEIQKVEDMSDYQKLTVILNQVLSLSTCSVYQKGFAVNYYNTELWERTSELIPYIAKAVVGKRCRDMAEQAIIICEKLADLIGNAAMVPAFEEKTIEWIKASIKDLDLFEAKTNESDEDTNNSDGKSPFENSDLYIILPDDEYDELMEKAKEKDSDDDGPTMHIRREHPKEEDTDNKTEENEPSTGSSSDSSNNSSSEGSNGSSSEESSDSQENSAASSDTDSFSNSEGNQSEPLENSKDQGSNDCTEEGEESSSSSKDSLSNNMGLDGEKHGDQAFGDNNECRGTDNKNSGQVSNSNSPNKGSNSGNANDEDSSSNSDDVLSKIEEQMEKAAKEANGMAKDNVESAERVIYKQEKAQSMKEDVSEPVKKTDEGVISSICNNYKHDYELKEVGRKYEVNTLLPPILVCEIETLAKKLETYMVEAKKRWRKFINSGKLDSSRVAMLAANNIDVFKESKISKGTKACAELIVDNSGSMGYGSGSKREYACIALAKIEMVFAKYFPIKIFAFDANGNTIIHEIIKGWNEHFSRSASYNFLEKGRSGSSNFDGFSIRVATADILSRPEKRKLLVVLSDGLPCYESTNDVKNAVAEARAKGITVVGIYFSESDDNDSYERNTQNEFKEMYQKDYIITRPENIDTELIKILKKFFM